MQTGVFSRRRRTLVVAGEWILWFFERKPRASPGSQVLNVEITTWRQANPVRGMVFSRVHAPRIRCAHPGAWDFNYSKLFQESQIVGPELADIVDGVL